jgi:hypothetical protein
MLKIKKTQMDELVRNLQSAAYDVIQKLDDAELRVPIPDTSPQYYLTISRGRSTDVKMPPKMTAEIRTSADHEADKPINNIEMEPLDK